MPGGAAAALRSLTEPEHELGDRLRASERAILVWSGPGGGGGARLAEAAHALGFDGKPGCGAFHLPATPNGGGVAMAWSAASDEEETNPEPIGLLIVSGVEAAADAGVRALAEKAEHVIAVTMFHGVAVGWADLVLPATSPLERDGTLINLEGRVQRQRRAVVAPVPDELAWIAKLAERFGVELSPHPTTVFAELSQKALGGLAAGAIGGTAPLPARAPFVPPTAAAPSGAPTRAAVDEPLVGELRLLRYRPLFSGCHVDRVHELQFQRPAAEVELSADDAATRGIASGDTVTVRSNGSSVELRARVNRRLVPGVARVADEHAGDLHQQVEVPRSAP
jgi:anaerobic selenocysteine-containing dehydrogenase